MDPNFFIVGGAKCGTTNMSYNLMEHEEIFMPKLNAPYQFCRLAVSNDFFTVNKKKQWITNK